jgi:hypothetical protein
MVTKRLSDCGRYTGVRLFRFERAGLGQGGYRKSDKGRANVAETENATVVLPEPIVKGKDLIYQLLSIARSVVHKKVSDPIPHAWIITVVDISWRSYQ